ncbi:hypothetical protein AGDE_10095 [Angomonas deanei]|nr:hypothetical protein AGDE_10095 [Angomonas deanei]|eukprot:EPY29161.1 hypothetical protein AGDE_10095 [Angomonas deanei]
MAQNWTPSSTILTVVLPYVFALLWALYYFLFKRSKKFSREELAPFLTFYDQLTKGATAGFDKEFLRLFHPGFFHTKEREMRDTGLLRAIARGVQDCYGPVKHIDEHVVVHKQSGLSFNCAVLVDFQKVRRVQCQLSWVVRLPSVMKSAQKGSKELHELMISGIRRAPVGSFHVTGFKIVPPKQHEIDFLKYIEIDDFISLGELFVEKLLTKQDTLVDFFVPSLADKYKDAAQRDDLWGGVTRTLAACGGLKESDMDPIFAIAKL